MADEKAVDRRLDTGSKFITGSVTFAIALFMFFLGMFCNSLSGRVDLITIKAYANEKDIAIVKADYLAKQDTTNARLTNIENLLKEKK